MMPSSEDDRWLLPRRQTEYPTRDLLPEITLHGRREVTFLVLAALFLVTTTALLVLGTTRVVDVGALLATLVPELEVPVAMLVPLGALPFAVSFVASALVCELSGRRRASALIWVGLVASLGLAGVMRVGDVIDGGDAFGVALALAAGSLVAHATNLVVFDALRRAAPGRLRWARITAASLLAQLAGWSAFGLVLHGAGGLLVEPVAPDTIIALAIGSAACGSACVLVLALPAALAARGLVVFLRVGRELTDIHAAVVAPVRAPSALVTRPGLAEGSVARPLPAATIVEDVDDSDDLPGTAEEPCEESYEEPNQEPIELPRARAARASIPPYSSAEMRFFVEGDLLAKE